MQASCTLILHCQLMHSLAAGKIREDRIKKVETKMVPCATIVSLPIH